ncbi:unnamed protein product, partial [Didymodactylos carnosus]
NTPMWLAYMNNNLDTVFALLELGVDINRRTGTMQASDVHRGCGWGDDVFIEILIDCGANVNLEDGCRKTPLIYAIEYRTSLNSDQSTNANEDLIRFLIEKGANINHSDISGLTPLHYACYRGDVRIVDLLLTLKADYNFENALGYSPFRYSLGCLSYANPNDKDIYTKRLNVVELLVEQFSRDELKKAIIGNGIPFLFPLFDFLFYSLIQQRHDLEQIGWDTFLETCWPYDSTYGTSLVAQNILVFNQNLKHIIYFLQRMYLCDYTNLIIFYLQRVLNDKEPNRFLLLLYCTFVDYGHLSKQIFKTLLYTQRTYLFKLRRDSIKSLIHLCQQTPPRLLFLCRKTIRQILQTAIHRKIDLLENYIPKNLKNYLLLDELQLFSTPITMKKVMSLVNKSIRINSTINIFNNIQVSTLTTTTISPTTISHIQVNKSAIPITISNSTLSTSSQTTSISSTSTTVGEQVQQQPQSSILYMCNIQSPIRVCA